MSTAARIAEKLTGRKVLDRGGNYLVQCPAHEDDSPSLSLRDGDRGVQVHCFAGCRPAEIYAAIRRIDENLLKAGDMTPEPTKDSSEYERRQHEKAAWLWSQRRPIRGTLADIYLRQARGITCALPPTVAYLRPAKPSRHPALITAFGLIGEPEPGMMGEPGAVDSIHLTLLSPDGGGKADVAMPKLTVGTPGNKPIVLAPMNDLLGLAVTEGIEDGLSVYQATGLGIWAAGSGGRMAKLAELMPSHTGCVTIYAHNDKAGRNGAYQLAEALIERQIEVFLEGLPP